MNKRFVVVVLLLLALLGVGFASSAKAAEQSVQDILNGITLNPKGLSSVNVATDKVDPDGTWALSASGGSIATLIIEIAGNQGVNAFGVYDAADPSKRVEIFAGTDAAGSQSSFGIGANGSVFVKQSDTGIDFAANRFGFYMANTDNNLIFYSNDALNTDDYDHMWAFQGKGDTVQLPLWASGVWAANEYVLAWEDTYGGGDFDHNDMVLMVESVSPVPEPATIIFVGLGLVSIGFFGRRARKA